MRYLRALLLAGLLVLAPGTRAAAVEIKAGYTVSLSGINIAKVTVTLAENAGRYTIALDADVSGLGQMVASGTAKSSSSGAVGSTGLAAQNFSLATRANGEDFSVTVAYAKGDVSSFVVEPPLVNNIDRVPIERAHLGNVTDPLSALVLRGVGLGRSLCDRSVRIFTGVERFDLRMTFAAEDVATSPRTGYQGPVALCKVRYKPVSGHFTTSEITNYLAGSDRILVWYAPVGDTGYFVPYRVLLTTSMGDLSMVLTGLSH